MLAKKSSWPCNHSGVAASRLSSFSLAVHLSTFLVLWSECCTLNSEGWMVITYYVYSDAQFCSIGHWYNWLIWFKVCDVSVFKATWGVSWYICFSACTSPLCWPVCAHDGTKAEQQVKQLLIQVMFLMSLFYYSVYWFLSIWSWHGDLNLQMHYIFVMRYSRFKDIILNCVICLFLKGGDVQF